MLLSKVTYKCNRSNQNQQKSNNMQVLYWYIIIVIFQFHKEMCSILSKQL